MLSSVAVLAYPGVSTFGLGVTAEIFGCDRSAEGLPAYDYTITAAVPGVIPTHVRLPIIVAARPDPPSTPRPGHVLCLGPTDVVPPPPVVRAPRACAPACPRAGGNGARPGPPRSPAAWWCPRPGTAARPSTCRCASTRQAPPRPWQRCTGGPCSIPPNRSPWPISGRAPGGRRELAG